MGKEDVTSWEDLIGTQSHCTSQFLLLIVRFFDSVDIWCADKRLSLSASQNLTRRWLTVDKPYSNEKCRQAKYRTIIWYIQLIQPLLIFIKFSTKIFLLSNTNLGFHDVRGNSHSEEKFSWRMSEDSDLGACNKVRFPVKDGTLTTDCWITYHRTVKWSAADIQPLELSCTEHEWTRPQHPPTHPCHVMFDYRRKLARNKRSGLPGKKKNLVRPEETWAFAGFSHLQSRMCAIVSRYHAAWYIRTDHYCECWWCLTVNIHTIIIHHAIEVYWMVQTYQ